MPSNASATPHGPRQSKLPRMTSWWLIATVLSLAVFLIAPQQLPVSLYKLNLISLAALAGYWIDRAVFPYARPQVSALRDLDDDYELELTEEESTQGFVKTDDGREIPVNCIAEGLCGPIDPTRVYFMLGCMLRRALIMSAAILAISLGG
ncbi:putative holin [Comamonas resistens]|uniref:putative holin n=1 Tax=Comamonas resistens TaxID=3046670 RepID=UPI0039BCE872